ncbi:VOC family protein [Amycolatopsis rubida]|uniref:Methylmalonyl-CoA/ethylmalonyl-CoA epimerase n=1 Tax=Amycolatopsis rubida TaxID=112413 RepID=A0A1I5SDI3_9PSEU|nr:VOC family protein [Amycolatopsis rubida]SFP68818.1 methylmalonyl-CoA/ethylmalonyl-CoA epimerase [Amycolatopsis rubida]
MSLALGHVGYTVSDLDAAIAFFTEHFGFVLRHRQLQDNDYTRATVGVPDAVVDNAILTPAGHVDGCELQLLQYVVPALPGAFAPVAQPGSAHLALEVTDLAQLYRRSSASGVRFTSAPNRIDSGRNAGGLIAYALGPDNLRIELVQRPQSGTPASIAQQRGTQEDR